MADSRPIVIAGAGIGGLTAALTLARAGFQVTVLERAETLSTAGAGIQLAPNAGHVLAGLGLDKVLAETASEPAAMEVRSGRSGRLLSAMPLGPEMRRRFGAPYRTIHRADLQAALAAAAARAGVDLVLGADVQDFALSDIGVTARAATRDGPAVWPAAALVGADGVHSILRALVPKTAPAEATARTAWRAIVAVADAPPALATDRVGLWLGPGAHLVHYPVRGGREINLVAIVRDGFSGAGWSAPGDPADLAAMFRSWCGPAREIVAAPQQWRRWAVLSVPPGGPMAHGPVALLGDAAHAMPPYLAQGGAMAIEDAAVLASALAAGVGDIPAALMRYQQARAPRVAQVWRSAEITGRLFEMGAVTGAARDLGMRLLGARGLARRYAWIYGWRP